MATGSMRTSDPRSALVERNGEPTPAQWVAKVPAAAATTTDARRCFRWSSGGLSLGRDAPVQRDHGRLLCALHQAIVEHGREQTPSPSSDRYRIQHSHSLNRSRPRSIRWMLPWTCVLALSATVACAGDKAILSGSPGAPPGGAATSISAVPTESAMIGGTLTLSSVDGDGTRATLVCLRSADVLAIKATDIGATAVANLCRPSTEIIIRRG